jgi:hypothetical protein
MEELHWGHTGSVAKEKLSLIHPLHESFVQDQISVISSGMSSSGFFLELYMSVPLSLLGFSYALLIIKLRCPKHKVWGIDKQQKLQFYNVLCLWTAVALNHVEFYALAFVEGLVAVAYDCAEVNEYIVAAFNFDETEAFLCVEPFHCTCLHVVLPPKCDIHDLFIFLKIKNHILYKVIRSKIITLYNM